MFSFLFSFQQQQYPQQQQCSQVQALNQKNRYYPRYDGYTSNIPYGPYECEEDYSQWYDEGWYQDENGEWYQDPEYAYSSSYSTAHHR